MGALKKYLFSKWAVDKISLGTTDIYLQLVQMRGQPWRHITPRFSTRPLSLPKPQDYNIFLRILGINPVLGSQPHPECV